MDSVDLTRHSHLGGCVWSPEVDVRCLPLLLSTLLTEAEFPRWEVQLTSVLGNPISLKCWDLAFHVAG